MCIGEDIQEKKGNTLKPFLKLNCVELILNFGSTELRL